MRLRAVFIAALLLWSIPLISRANASESIGPPGWPLLLLGIFLGAALMKEGNAGRRSARYRNRSNGITRESFPSSNLAESFMALSFKIDVRRGHPKTLCERLL